MMSAFFSSLPRGKICFCVVAVGVVVLVYRWWRGGDDRGSGEEEVVVREVVEVDELEVRANEKAEEKVVKVDDIDDAPEELSNEEIDDQQAEDEMNVVVVPKADVGELSHHQSSGIPVDFR